MQVEVHEYYVKPKRIVQLMTKIKFLVGMREGHYD